MKNLLLALGLFLSQSWSHAADSHHRLCYFDHELNRWVQMTRSSRNNENYNLGINFYTKNESRFACQDSAPMQIRSNSTNVFLKVFLDFAAKGFEEIGQDPSIEQFNLILGQESRFIAKALAAQLRRVDSNLFTQFSPHFQSADGTKLTQGTDIIYYAAGGLYGTGLGAVAGGIIEAFRNKISTIPWSEGMGHIVQGGMIGAAAVAAAVIAIAIGRETIGNWWSRRSGASYVLELPIDANFREAYAKLQDGSYANNDIAVALQVDFLAALMGLKSKCEAAAK